MRIVYWMSINFFLIVFNPPIIFEHFVEKNKSLLFQQQQQQQRRMIRLEHLQMTNDLLCFFLNIQCPIVTRYVQSLLSFSFVHVRDDLRVGIFFSFFLLLFIFKKLIRTSLYPIQ